MTSIDKLSTMSADPITRAAQWLADLPRVPDNASELLIQRFGLRSWEAERAIVRARKMKMLRSAFA